MRERKETDRQIDRQTKTDREKREREREREYMYRFVIEAFSNIVHGYQARSQRGHG